MDTEQTLKGALSAVTQKSIYGTKRESFGRMARIASELTGKQLTAEDCCKVLIALKLSRESFAHNDDHMVDLAGYASILNELYQG